MVADLCSYFEFAITVGRNVADMMETLEKDSNKAAWDAHVARMNAAPDLHTSVMTIAELYIDYAAQKMNMYRSEMSTFTDLLAVIVDKIVSLDDQSLASASKTIQAISAQPFQEDDRSHLNDFLARSESLKPLFSHDEWIEIVKLQSDAKHSM
jgi:hypothetical protein